MEYRASLPPLIEALPPSGSLAPFSGFMLTDVSLPFWAAGLLQRPNSREFSSCPTSLSLSLFSWQWGLLGFPLPFPFFLHASPTSNLNSALWCSVWLGREQSQTGVWRQTKSQADFSIGARKHVLVSSVSLFDFLFARPHLNRAQRRDQKI
jgi:hypothetical protein